MANTFELVIVVSAIVQASTAVVIAIAAVKYTQFTKQLLDVQIPPAITVDITGEVSACALEIGNDAGCDVRDLEVSISVGYLQHGEPTSVRKCIYQRLWPKMASGSRLTEQLAIEREIVESADGQPDGIEPNANDIRIEYSFIRKADRRRFCYGYQAGCVRHANGKQFLARLQPPQSLDTMKRIIVRPIDSSRTSNRTA